MRVTAYSITGNTVVYSTGCSGEHERKHKTSHYWYLVMGFHRWKVGSHEKRIFTVSSPWAHRELTVTTVVTAPGPMITAQSRLGEVTAQSRRGHSSDAARSQLSHGEVTAQSRHLQYDHGSVTARSQLNHGPGHGWLWPFWSPRAHCELTVSSHGGQFFLMGR